MKQSLSTLTLLTASPDLEDIGALPDEFQGWRVIRQPTDWDAGWSRHVFIPVRLYQRLGFGSFMLLQDSL